MAARKCAIVAIEMQIRKCALVVLCLNPFRRATKKIDRFAQIVMAKESVDSARNVFCPNACLIETHFINVFVGPARPIHIAVHAAKR